MEHPIDKLHRYVWILFGVRIEGPFWVLGLWGGGCLYPLPPIGVPALKSLDYISNRGSIEQTGKRNYSLTQLGGSYMLNPACGLTRRNSSFSPLYKEDKIFTRAAAEAGPLRP